ncbi:MAG: hypothetical protein K6A42_04240 [Treponema sp.]|nr:hypothetical protein [Treponema sp.]
MAGNFFAAEETRAKSNEESESENSAVIQTKEEAAARLLEEESAEEKTAAESSSSEKEAKEEADSENKDKKKSKKKKKGEKESEAKAEEEKDQKTVITIMNALKSGNKKDEKNGDELLTFDGNVKISVEKNGTKTIISGDKVSYNRARNMLFAEGAVTLEQTESSGATQSISSDSLLFNTETLEGVFDNSRVVKAESNAINLPSGSKITVASDLFARDDSGTISFKNGALTFCDEEENPHWKIKASRIWLLPGNEFAFLNARVYVGPVPVMYLPAFYYPKDELIFNPVFGYRNRAGYFFQTSTYIFGRKPLDTSKTTSSTAEEEDDILGDYFSLIKPTKLMDQKREGLILHNLDTEYKGDTSNYLKIILDYYTNLGIATGFEGVYKGSGNIPQIEAGAVLGFSNTVFQDTSTGNWHSFAPSGNTYKDESNFMGIWIPFRYKANLKFSGSAPLNYSLSLPVYSDPYFNYDFGDRNETMDWFSYLLNNPNQDSSTKTETEKQDAAEITSFTWESNVSYNVKVPEFLNPYVTSISLSSFNSSISFSEATAKFENLSTVETSDKWSTYTPNRKFFYPSTVTPLKTGITISGTVFSTSKTKKVKLKKSEQQLAMGLIDLDFNDKEESESKEESEETEGSEKKESKSESDQKKDDALLDKTIIPDLSFTLPSQIDTTPFAYDLTYSFSPDFSSQITYASEPLKKAGDFDFNKLKTSFIQVKLPLSLKSNLGFYDNFFGITNNITFEPFYQKHPYIADAETDSSGVSNGGYSESSKKSLQETDYKASYMKLYSANSVAFMPLVYYKHFKETKISWNTTINWLRTQFIGDADNPEWDYLTVDWNDKDAITSHTLSATMAANEFGERFKQSLTLTATLPPQVDKYYATLNLTFPYLTTTAETGMAKTSATDDTWKKEQIRHSATLSLFDSKLKLTESYNYEWEEWHHDSFKVALTYQGLQAAYTMRYTTPYDFEGDTRNADGSIASYGKGWVAKSEKEFLPYSLSIAYSSPNTKFKKWKNRIEVTPGLSTSISYDFIRPTQSYFIFTPSITFKLHKFFFVKFSMETRNDVIYRYFQDAAGESGRIPGETNPIIDLINGFRFDDENLRKSSGFKLKSFVLQITHDLHDWDFNMKFKISPRLVTPTGGQKYYDFSPYFSLSVVWRPMDSIKTKIADKYGDFVLNGNDSEDK